MIAAFWIQTDFWPDGVVSICESPLNAPNSANPMIQGVTN
jgi:hypothetical protein